MKCMANIDETVVIRVTDEEADVLVHEGFHHVAKSVWKEKVRDIDKEVHENPVGVGFTQKDMKKKSNKMSRSTKRHMRKVNK